MKIIQDLLNILPNILLYLVTGYLYISIFHFVALKESKEEMNHVLTSSLVIGYIIVNIMNMIPFSISYSVDSIGIAFTGAVSGFVFGKIYHGRLFDRTVQLFHIRSTPNKYIWTDLMDMDYPIYVTINMKDGNTYCGYVSVIEEFNRNPQIALASYKQTTPDGITIDHEYDHQSVILVDTQDAKSIIIHYDEDSGKQDRIKLLINLHNEEGSPTYREHHQNQ